MYLHSYVFLHFCFFFGRHMFYFINNLFFLEITEWETWFRCCWVRRVLFTFKVTRVYCMSQCQWWHDSIQWLDSSHNEWLETRVRVIFTKYSKVVNAHLWFYVIIGRDSQHYIIWCKTGLRSGKSNSKLRPLLQHPEVFGSGSKIICSVKTENHCFISTIVPLHHNRWHIAK